MLLPFLLPLFVLLICLLPTATIAGFDGQHLAASLLKEVEGAPCVRLFSSQGTTGCRTPHHDGTTAPLYSYTTAKDFQALDQPVAVVLPLSLFNDPAVMNVVAARAPTLTQGVIVLDDDQASPSTTTYISPDLPTPQGQGSPSAAFTIGPTHAWNPTGNGLSMQKFDFPIVLATGASAQEVAKWAEHNGDLSSKAPYPRYKAVFDFYFGPSSSPAAVNGDGGGGDLTSSDCLNWHDVEGKLTPQCMPMGGQSVWGSLGGRTGLQKKPTVLLTAAMDGTSLFRDMTPAANEAVASIVALLAATSALANASALGAIDINTAPNNLAVALFQGDEWGFVGSRRFAQDIALGGVTCVNDPVVPLNLSRDGSGACVGPTGVYPSLAFTDLELGKLVHVLAVDQVGVLPPQVNADDPSVPLTALYDGDGDDAAPTVVLEALAAAVASLRGGGSAAAATAEVTPLSSPGAMPPTPLTSFLREARSTALPVPLSGVVLAGYNGDKGGAFLDPRYHSHQDNVTFLGEDPAIALGTVATLLARTAWGLMVGGDAPPDAATLATIEVEPAFVSALLTCMTEDWNCPLLKQFRQGEMENLKHYLGRSYVYTPPVPSTPNYYSGIIASYQGLPLAVTHNNNANGDDDGGASVKAAWPETGPAFVSDAEDRFYVIPKPLEASLRGFLAHTLEKASSNAATPLISCQSTTDCETHACDGNLSSMECLASVCVCRTRAFYHTALDPGLAPKETPDTFTVVDPKSPNWAEPNWQTIGLSVFPDTSRRVERTALGVGLGVVAMSALGALLVQRVLTKHHYFD